MRRKSPVSLLALAGIIAAGLGLTAPTTASAAMTTPVSQVVAPAPQARVATTPMPFGLFQSDNHLDYSLGTPASRQYKFEFQYYSWQELPQSAMISAMPAGMVPFLKLQSCKSPCGSTGIPLASITAGTYDGYLTNYAAGIAALGRPVLLTFNHEANGSWYPWDATNNGASTGVTPAMTIAAWNHVTSVINSNAAAKKLITWVWAQNIEQGASPIAPFWSSGGVTVQNVGAVGLDGYYVNTGTTWANRFASSYADIMAASGGTKPFYVAETGIPAGDSNATSQEANLISAAKSVGAKGIMYFNAVGRSNYIMSPAMQAAWLKDIG